MRSQRQPLHDSANSIPPVQLRHLILKLRWIGMEQEAREMSERLARVKSNTETLIEVSETD
jgi:hypothetical protein